MGEERTLVTCSGCGSEDAHSEGVVVGQVARTGEVICNICLSRRLRKRTSLSEREAEVTSLKQLGYSHTRIAHLISSYHEDAELTRSTVGEYSQRMQQKANIAKNTHNELREFVNER